MAVYGLANSIMPQSHGDVSDYEETVGKSNVSYDTLRVQDPMANLSPTANHSFNIVGHTNYFDRLIGDEVSALDLFLKDAQSNIDSPRSYLDIITHDLGVIREDNIEHMAETRRQNAKTKKQEFQEKDIESIKARTKEEQFLESRAQDVRAEARILVAESTEQAKENKAINDQAVEDDRDARVMESMASEEMLLEKNLEEQIVKDQRTQGIIEARGNESQIREEYAGEKLVEAEVIEKKADIQYAESREMIVQAKQAQNVEVEVDESRVLQEKVAEAQAMKDKSAGIKYSEDTISIEENFEAIESMIVADNASVAEAQDENPEMLQMSFGVNLVV